MDAGSWTYRSQHTAGVIHRAFKHTIQFNGFWRCPSPNLHPIKPIPSSLFASEHKPFTVRRDGRTAALSNPLHWSLSVAQVDLVNLRDGSCDFNIDVCR